MPNIFGGWSSDVGGVQDSSVKFLSFFSNLNKLSHFLHFLILKYFYGKSWSWDLPTHLFATRVKAGGSFVNMIDNYTYT